MSKASIISLISVWPVVVLTGLLVKSKNFPDTEWEEKMAREEKMVRKHKKYLDERSKWRTEQLLKQRELHKHWKFEITQEWPPLPQRPD